MALKDVAAVLAKDFVTLRLDTDRMLNADAVLKRYNQKSEGIPWFVFVDGDGRPIITSTDPDNGNIGFPAADSEIAHFKVMLEKAAKRMTPADIDMLVKSLIAFRDVKLPTT